MKKIISVIVALFMLLGSLSVFAESSPEKMYIFVQAGAEGGNGSKDSPFATFEQARDKIREIKKEGKYPEGGVVVYFREGIYSISESITLNEEDSGTKEAPIVYRAYMEEQVSFVGGVDLPVSSFKKVTDAAALARIKPEVKDSILCANLKDEFGLTDYGELNMYGMGLGYYTNTVTAMEKHGVHIPTEQPPELFFGNESGVLARYPNSGEWIYTGAIIQHGDDIQWWSSTWQTSEQFVPEEERVYPPKPSIWQTDANTTKEMKKWKNEDDIWVYGTLGENWSDNSLPVKEIDFEKGIITTEFPSPKLIKSDMKYYIYNVLGELDVPGEYYLDRNTGILYIYPTDAGGTVTFSNLNSPVLKLDGVENVKFKSLAIKGTRKHCIMLDGCIDVDFELCSVSKAAGYGIVGYNLKDCNFTSCHIYQTGTGGITIALGGKYNTWIETDAVEKLIPQNNVVENCEVNYFSRIKATYSPAISFNGTGNVIRNCKVYDGDHYAITPNGNDHLIENCEFTDLLRTADDSGAIYTGYNKQHRGLVIRNNYFHDIASTSPKGTDISMLYPDDTNSDYTVYQNLFVNIGGRVMHSNGGDSHTITDNIAINLGNVFLNFNAHPDDLAGKYAWEKYTFQKYLDNPAYAKYDNFSDITKENYLRVVDITTDRNVIWNTGGTITNQSALDHSLNNISMPYEISGDPGFVDMANGIYTLNDDSIIYKKFPDFKAPDFENMGMYTAKLQALLGDNKAFYTGSPKVYNGWTPEAINPRYDASPSVKDGVYYLPVRYITESLGGEVSYNADTAEVTVNYSSPVVLTQDEYITTNGTSFISTERIAEIFDTGVKAFENGVILVGKDIRIEAEDTDILAELARRLCNE